jgi:hypothetical protein
VNGPQHFYTSMNQTQKYAAKVLNSLRLEGVSAEMINCWIVLEKFVVKKVKIIYGVLTGGKLRIQIYRHMNIKNHRSEIVF